jgi:hypothetical protein
MFKRTISYAILLCCGAWIVPASAQQDIKCTSADAAITRGEVYINYGGVSDAHSIRNRSSNSIGQSVAGVGVSALNNGQLGFWSLYQIPPLKPIVTATQGDLLDRIQVSWTVDPLSAQPTEGFKLYRDGVFLALLDSKTFNFNDFNVIAGRPYNYEVRGINEFGTGQAGRAVGFQVPDGVVTGWVQTPSGRPVPDAIVTLTPLQGFSAAFGAGAGAFAKADTATHNLLPAANGAWSLTFWIKTDSARANAGLISLDGVLFLRPKASAGGHEGIEVAQTAGGTALLSGQFPDSTKHGWHHITLTADAGKGRLYLNGTLVAIANLPALPAVAELRLGTSTTAPGAPGTPGIWYGRLDELRLYHSHLDELDLGEVMMGTASSQTPGLKYYWKMDEELGTGSFDVLRRNKLYFCGARFDADRPNVRTMGKTNEEGFYRIESASYGTGTTFLAEPMKNFYLHRALRFVPGEQDYATLPDFALTPKATVELWVNSADPAGTQCLLAKKWGSNEFRLLLKQNGLESDVVGYLNGQEHIFGTLGMGYQHLALTIDSTGIGRAVTAYKNGVAFGSAHTFTGVSGNWSEAGQTWMLGALPTGATTQADYFDGLIDELAVYDSTLSAAAILGHAQNPRNAQEKGLRVYFALDEGSGSFLHNTGSALLADGANKGAAWSAFAVQQKTTPHEFTPVTRQVSLNPSVTSVDQVDFTDRSTVPVTGFVRYANTDCFAKNVEILVNGESFSPKIFTDSTGKFEVDFDPGFSGRLTPKFEDHTFIPAFWEVTNVVSPIAGVLFNDMTTRTVKGAVAGGHCHKSIVSTNTVCRVTVRSTDGCLERSYTLNSATQDTGYVFTELPPLESLTIAVTEHSNPDIKAAFQTQGGSTLDLSKKDTSINFIYFASPQVEIASGLDPIAGCMPEVYVLDQKELVTLNLKLKEQYEPVAATNDDGVCYLDTAKFELLNGLADRNLDTIMSGGVVKYQFRVGGPNPSPPYLKTLEIVGTSLAGRTGTLLRQAIVTGILQKGSTFTTMLPEIPTLILRDPPGDASSSYLEENRSVCHTITFAKESQIGVGGGVEIHLGGDVTIVTAPLGVGTIENSGPIFDTEISTVKTFVNSQDNSLQTCMSFNTRVSTSDGSSYIGEDADLYMGSAVDIKLGFADKVEFDYTTCAASDTTVLNVEPGNQPTTFIYSQAYIKNYLQPYLQKIAADTMTTDSVRLQSLKSDTLWTNILARNKGLKERARFKRHISFDATTSFEYSETSDTTDSHSSQSGGGLDFSLLSHIGFQFQEFGVQAIVDLSDSSLEQDGTGNETATGITTGYILADDDDDDAFSLDVLMDSVYRTPVFKLYAGQSSCPWEKGTAHRERPNLQLAAGTGFKAENVPAHEPAVFQLNLGNLSATNEDWNYSFSAIPANNPHGAVIKLNGQPLNGQPIDFFIPYGTSTPVTLTIERGPVEYAYDSLLVAFYSECEYEADLSLHNAPDTVYFSRLYLGAHFIRPCSEVNINVPEQNWVVLNNDPNQPGTVRRITVSGYDLNSSDFQSVRLQYRRSNGDGAWVNIKPEAGKAFELYNKNWSGFADLTPAQKNDTLTPGFSQFFWETEGLSDGPYEIHAWAVCTGDASDKPGFSQIINGRIDREPPSLVGKPQPSDGVYHVGDEISFTFNQHVNCDKLIIADQTQPNNVGLYDGTTNELIDISVTCFENKIVLDPTFENKFFENRILRAELHDIEDLTGNKGSLYKWEFFVDRNELAWLTDSIGMTKYEDNIQSVVARIHNRGGYPVPFKIKDTPPWVRVVPDTGVIVANEIRDIRFEVDSSLAFGLWSDSITLHTVTGQNPFFMGGDERLPLGVRVVCRPPNWDLYAGLYENSMNLVLQLDIEGTLSTDGEDIVAAYIDNELRGRSRVQYEPQTDKWLAYLTVYGTPDDAQEPIRFEVWDASACLRYGLVQETFLFEHDHIIGDPEDPQVIHTNSLILREIPIGYGWNWLSFNLAFPDNSINSALASLTYPGLIRNQTDFSYFDFGAWIGSLTQLDNTSMYVYGSNEPDTLRMMGNLIDPADMPIPLASGWNWIGYIPNYALPVNEALSSVFAQKGDLIKSQTSFAQYLNADAGWVGNLKFMAPPNGYQLRLADTGNVLIYPPPKHPQVMDNPVEARGEPDAPPVSGYWTVNPTQYEYSMTLIGMLADTNGNATTGTMELGAFVGGEVRGSAQAIYVGALQAHLFFLTIYANTSGELLNFKLHDSSNGQVYLLNEEGNFASNLHEGDIQDPVPFTVKSVGLSELAGLSWFEVQPNPFQSTTTVQFGLDQARDVQLLITDVTGRIVLQQKIAATQGRNTFRWNGAELPSGMYFVRLETADGAVVHKVVRE